MIILEIETVSLGKKKGNLYSSFIIKNLLLDLKMNTPKFSFIIIQPTEPSRLISNSFCASTANSIGNLLSTSLA